MEKTKITLRVPQHLVTAAKDYAKRHDTSLTRLISEYLERLSKQENGLDDAPTVKRLSGVLPSTASKEEFQEHVDKKYGG